MVMNRMKVTLSRFLCVLSVEWLHSLLKWWLKRGICGYICAQFWMSYMYLSTVTKRSTNSILIAEDFSELVSSNCFKVEGFRHHYLTLIACILVCTGVRIEFTFYFIFPSQRLKTDNAFKELKSTVIMLISWSRDFVVPYVELQQGLKCRLCNIQVF